MKDFFKVLGAIGVGLVLAVVLFKSPVNSPTFGSTNIANDYLATTTAQGTAAGDYILKTTPGALGSITVASSSASTFTVLDADGTNTTTVATLKAAIGERTYMFDRSMRYGVIITVPSGFNGQYITTYR